MSTTHDQALMKQVLRAVKHLELKHFRLDSPPTLAQVLTSKYKGKHPEVLAVLQERLAADHDVTLFELREWAADLAYPNRKRDPRIEEALREVAEQRRSR